MAKRHRRSQNSPKLNLVSLMDIFTILVFFLLVNSSDVEVLSSDKSIELPTSVADTQPETALVVMLNSEQILVGGRPVAQVATIGDEPLIDALLEELNYRASHAPLLTAEQEQKGRPITIMGDK